MPRTLPWLLDENTSKPSSTRNGANSAAGTRASKKVRRASRTPSTSPPPAPPDVEYMRDGDHEWIMVEDEFLATAQTFTQHLHHAEYQRMKQLNKQKTQNTLDSIKRPTKGDAVTDKASARALDVSAKRVKLDESASVALRKTGAIAQLQQEQESEDSDDLFIEDRELAGLMHGVENGEVRHDVSSAAGALPRSKTRAAAGMRSNALLPGSGRPSSHSTTKVRNAPSSNHAATTESRLAEQVAAYESTFFSRVKKPKGCQRPAIGRMRTPPEEDSNSIPNCDRDKAQPGAGVDTTPLVVGSVASEPSTDVDRTRSSPVKSRTLMKDRMKARREQREREQQHEEGSKSRTRDDEIPLFG